MKRKYLIPLLLLLLMALLAGCCSHEWEEADCKHPQTCAKCGETKGEALGHTWVDANCEKPKTCSVCGETKGEALGHTWVDADCEKPQTCSVCGATEGEALGHDWLDADCQNPKTCSVCGKTEGEVGDHVWIDATYTDPKTCAVCGATEGEPLDEPVVISDLGVSVSDFASLLNTVMNSSGYQLVPLYDGDNTMYTVSTVDGSQNLDIVISFLVMEDTDNVMMVLGLCSNVTDAETMTVLGVALGGSMVIADNTITPDEVNDMLTQEPVLEDDGSYTYSMHKNGIDYMFTISEAESMAMFGIYPTE